MYPTPTTDAHAVVPGPLWPFLVLQRCHFNIHAVAAAFLASGPRGGLRCLLPLVCVPEPQGLWSEPGIVRITTGPSS